MRGLLQAGRDEVRGEGASWRLKCLMVLVVSMVLEARLQDFHHFMQNPQDFGVVFIGFRIMVADVVLLLVNEMLWWCALTRLIAEEPSK
jgi:hypothetical protein